MAGNSNSSPFGMTPPTSTTNPHHPPTPPTSLHQPSPHNPYMTNRATYDHSNFYPTRPSPPASTMSATAMIYPQHPLQHPHNQHHHNIHHHTHHQHLHQHHHPHQHPGNSADFTHTPPHSQTSEF